MELVFSSMFKLRELPRELAIRNLQNVNQSDSEVSASIAQVLRNLHTLRLNIVSEYDEAAPENTITVSVTMPQADLCNGILELTISRYQSCTVFLPNSRPSGFDQRLQH